MHIDDRFLGLILVGMGTAIYLIARTFPLMAGIPYGPGFFPSIAAVGLIVCGIIIAVTGTLKSRAAPVIGSGASVGSAARGALLRPLIICLVVIFFALALPVLGFHIAAVLTVGAAAFVFGAHPLVAPVLALAAAFGTHAVFYSVLRVPLPWGILTPYAW
ncbi:tripartite tricarboxylate transporter TctB family protein [Acuticoccus sp. MNP-M23]|uniref:tripartite tricarboxylate transporter TctB family protein n=1 Tax=Acuticoccus sp. MNP-M23 TaxID=3072793 RepID=UPI0028149B0A|nr:tripartite tricarboxylate transporter TctB family protein [Acuticoccus sp. MNP-M23]WMS43623.1 tripartite tricarboxylate transporter TctB family protein [Acuticoccus sp. MNP-M23]